MAPSSGGQARGAAEALWGNQMAYGMGSHQMYGSGDRVDAEVGYGLPVGARFVGTPKVGISNSTYGRDYRFGYGLGVLEQGKVNFELAAEAQRRENPTAGEASKRVYGPGDARVVDVAPGRTGALCGNLHGRLRASRGRAPRR